MLLHTWYDADSVLSIDEEEYRALFPYPYFHYLPAIANLSDRPDLLAPTHLFRNIFLFAIFFCCLRFLLVRFLFKPFARYLEIIEDDYELFSESGIQMLYYASTWIVSAICLSREDWFWDPFYVFEGNFPNQPMGEEYYWIMSCHMGWYTFGLFAHLFIDIPKKDYWEMFTHHVVTLALLYFAFVKGYYRFVMLTLFCHDICDVFLHTVKMAKYVDNVRTVPDIVQIPAFLPLPFSWLVFRLFLFPRMVIYNSLIQCPRIVGIENCSYYWVYNPLLIVLYILQVYWFYLILKIAYKKLSGKGTFADIREGPDKTGMAHKIKTK